LGNARQRKEKGAVGTGGRTPEGVGMWMGGTSVIIVMHWPKRGNCHKERGDQHGRTRTK